MHEVYPANTAHGVRQDLLRFFGPAETFYSGERFERAHRALIGEVWTDAESDRLIQLVNQGRRS